mgnify:CR=1 FL=1
MFFFFLQEESAESGAQDFSGREDVKRGQEGGGGGRSVFMYLHTTHTETNQKSQTKTICKTTRTLVAAKRNPKDAVPRHWLIYPSSLPPNSAGHNHQADLSD